jgi:SAM-dependent methyltransferase
MTPERVAEKTTSSPQPRPAVASPDSTPGPPRCWCGNQQLEPFSEDYARCGVCQTLVLTRPPAQPDPHVVDDQSDFYGKDYWFKYQNELGYGNIVERSRSDLHDRCLHWLSATLKYKLPPGKSLELGCAHGGFVATLRWAGFDATGLELSPAIVRFAVETFQIPMLTGPLEDQKIRKKSLDVIAHMDVLEHLPDPVATMSRAVSLLKEDGIMVVQTPCYPEGATFEELAAKNHSFLQQLKPEEHLYLFSRSSIVEFFKRLGVEHHQFEPAIFAHYDMFVILSRSPLAAHSAEEQSTAVAQSPNGRAMLALLDLKQQSQIADRRLAESESDRAARLDVINKQGRETVRLQAEVHQLLESCKRLQTEVGRKKELEEQFRQSEADRAARLEVIQKQGQETVRLQAEVHQWLQKCKELQAQIDAKNDLEEQFRQSEADRAARLEVIQQQGREIAQLQAEVHQLLQNCQQLQAQIESKIDIEEQFRQSEDDRAARLEVINKQGLEIADLQAQVHKWLRICNQLQAELSEKIEIERQVRQGAHEFQLQATTMEPQLAELEKELQNSEREIHVLRAAITEHERNSEELSETLQKTLDRAEHLDREMKQARDDTAQTEKNLRESVRESDRLAAALAQNESERGNELAINGLLQEELQLLMRQSETLQAALRSLQSGLAYRALRQLGFFSAADKILVDPPPPGELQPWKPAAPGVILRTLQDYSAGIEEQINAQPNAHSRQQLRQHHWNTVDELNKIRPLSGKNVLDLGAFSPGYTLERVLQHGAAMYAGAGREVGMPQLLVPVEEQHGIGLLLNMDPAALTFQNEIFDAAISINALQRIGNLPAALRELHRVMRPQAAALLVFEPIWSCSHGHHLHSADACGKLIPPWAHLIWDDAATRRELAGRWPADAPMDLEEAIRSIYKTGLVNRMDIAALRRAISAGPLHVEWIVPLPDETRDEAMLENAARITGLSREDLCVRGLSVMLVKQ